MQFKSLFEFLKSNPTEQDCIDYYERLRWKGEMPVSPYDPTSKVYKCANNRYKCKNTKKYFTVRTGTVFRNSNISIEKWLWALYLFTSHKKGISSYQLTKHISITQKSAWFVLHRLRHISDCATFKEMLKDFVEVDETFIGGKNKNRHWDKKIPNSQGRSWKDKSPVWGAISNGILITEVVPNTQQETLEPIVKANIKESSTIYTDEWKAYNDLHKWFNHQRVNHGAKQYVNGKVSTNSIESAWACLKRSIYGTYHWVSKKHLPKYVYEFTLRFNTRKYSEQERFDLVLLASVGKSLSYSQLIS